MHNDVPHPHATYAWPAPHAYFTGWHCAVQDAAHADGDWLPEAEAEHELGRRHWWPLLRHLLAPRPVQQDSADRPSAL